MSKGIITEVIQFVFRPKFGDLYDHLSGTGIEFNISESGEIYAFDLEMEEYSFVSIEAMNSQYEERNFFALMGSYGDLQMDVSVSLQEIEVKKKEINIITINYTFDGAIEADIINFFKVLINGISERKINDNLICTSLDRHTRDEEIDWIEFLFGGSEFNKVNCPEVLVANKKYSILVQPSAVHAKITLSDRFICIYCCHDYQEIEFT